MVAPIEGDFKSPKRLLWAFKKGQVQNPKTLRPLQLLKDKFDTIINGLLVKTPGHKPGDLELDDAMKALVPEPTITANATTYQGVLEHFQSNQPDMLAVIKREQGFFEKLWKTSIVYKHEFYCSIPLLVLKPRSRYR